MVGLGRGHARHRRLRGLQRPRHRRPAARARRGRRCGRLVLASRWSATARAATVLRPRRRSRPPRATAPTCAAEQFEPRCPVCGRPLAPVAIGESRRCDPRNVYAATKVRAGAPVPRVGAGDRGAGDGAALPQRLRPADAAGHPVRRGGGDLRRRPGRGAAAAGVRGRWAAAGTSCTSATLPAANVLALQRASAPVPGAFNVAAARHTASATMAEALAAAAGGRRSAGGHRRVPPRRRAARVRVSRARGGVARLPSRRGLPGRDGRVRAGAAARGLTRVGLRGDRGPRMRRLSLTGGPALEALAAAAISVVCAAWVLRLWRSRPHGPAALRPGRRHEVLSDARQGDHRARRVPVEPQRSGRRSASSSSTTRRGRTTSTCCHPRAGAVLVATPRWS